MPCKSYASENSPFIFKTGTQVGSAEAIWGKENNKEIIQNIMVANMEIFERLYGYIISNQEFVNIVWCQLFFSISSFYFRQTKY
jgi:hypothetical protein